MADDTCSLPRSFTYPEFRQEENYFTSLARNTLRLIL